MVDCSKLNGRMRSICEGTSGLSETKRQAYIQMWCKQGRLQCPDIPAVPEPLRKSVRHTAPPTTKGCGGCTRRKNWLNRVTGRFRFGDKVEAVAEATGIKAVVDRWAGDSTDESVERVWAYGVTTVPTRFHTTLPRTLDSLKNAGFDRPRLFIDGPSASCGKLPLQAAGLPITAREDQIRTVGNWLLALWELVIREPRADYYAVFQDDLVAYKNLRQYLERVGHPEGGYLNLYTFPQNQRITQISNGWFQSNQRGLGAVALVFSQGAVKALLSSDHWTRKVECPRRSWKSLDGAIVTAFQKIGWKEYVHNPSLVQHIGDRSSMGSGRHPLAPSFRGENFDALELLGEPKHPVPLPTGEQKLSPRRRRALRPGRL